MKPLLASTLALVGILAGGAAIHSAGQQLAAEQAAIEANPVSLDAETEELALKAAEGNAAESPSDDLSEDSSPPEDDETSTGAYERVEPRAPLSELGPAHPPKPKPSPQQQPRASARLFNPVATSAGMIEAQGYKLVLAGVEPLPVDENCSYQGSNWPCGAQARTAFRSWLRARAVQCEVPPEPDPNAITTECRVGKDDLSQWLVASGWARPAGDGPYVEAGEKAKTAALGMYGAPPKRVNMTLSPPAVAPLDLPGVEPAPADTIEPPALPPTMNEIFPPAPTP